MNEFFQQLKSVHFVGVGGCSMSKLCAYTAQLGINCSGFDLKASDTTKKLQAMGVNIFVGDEGVKQSQIKATKADLVVYSSAIKKDSPELLVAKCKMERKDYLAKVASNFDKVIAISGAHGKTTTTAMLAWVMRSCGEHFYAHIGGNIIGINNLYCYTGNEYFVTEACEYSKSFLKLKPDIGVILNVAYDHPDCYKSLEDTYLAFAMFAMQSKTLVLNSACKRLLVNSDIREANITYGESNANYTYCNLVCTDSTCNFDVIKNGEFFDNYTLYTLNEINVNCAMAVIAIADKLNIDKKYIKLGIATFPGLENRFQCLGMSQNGMRLIVDYAHHPDQIEQAIISAKKIVPAGQRLFVVFEPHTYSRTKALLNDFIIALNGDWVCVIMPTFSARECESAGYNSFVLYRELCKKSENAVYVDSYQSMKKYLLKRGRTGDVALFLGAGLKNEEIIF